MERIYYSEYQPYKFMLEDNEGKDVLPTEGVPAGSRAWTVGNRVKFEFGLDGEWHEVDVFGGSDAAPSVVGTNYGVSVSNQKLVFTPPDE